MLAKARKYGQVIGYGAVFALLMLVIRWLEIRYIIMAHAFEIYAGAIALIFTCLGIWLALKLVKPKVQTQFIEREIYKPSEGFVFNQTAFEDMGLSKRELEVLQLMARGASNQEIADQLFVSLNTVKTHVSRLFEKLEVKRRTQAVELAQKLSLIP